MNARELTGLYLLGLIVVVIAGTFQPVPGYMDADYYYATGSQLAQGHGFWEPFLWNYLDDPSGLPHPGNTYWMPLGTILAAAGLWLSGLAGFGAARIGFLLLAACLPPLTAVLSIHINGSRRQALLSGCLAVFPGYYLVYLPATDTFGLYAVLGSLWLLAAWKIQLGGGAAGYRAAGALGLLSGLMHLARADGGLWLGLGLVWWVLFQRSQGPNNGNGFRLVRRPDWPALGYLFAGYLLVMGPWMARNLAITGAPLSPGAARALWITEYNELFTYPASGLTQDRWLATGTGLLGARIAALKANLLTALAVQGGIFLAPLVVAGAWRLRTDRRVKLGLLAWGLTGLVMTLVFPFQGARGGFFHSGAALQPFLWALAPVGLQALITWGARRRGWQPEQAWPVQGAGLIMLAVLLTVAIWLPRVAGGSWGESDRKYRQVERILQVNGARDVEAVLVNNPPGYFISSGRPSLAIPNGDASVAREVAWRYGGAYLILEKDHPQALEGLYRQPGDLSGWEYLSTTAGVHLFRLITADQEAGH